MATTKVSGELVDLNEATSESGLKIPTGTNNNRPATDVAGMVRNNTNETSDNSASCEEYYNGAAWKRLNNIPFPVYFRTVLYTGNGGTQAITGVGFKPDFVWIKNREGTTYHNVLDTTRGATKYLATNATSAEETTSDSLTSFDSDGFTLGGGNGFNNNGVTFVAWCWKANGGTTSSNTDGNITSTVQVNTAAGFSIVQFTNSSPGSSARVGHGLGSTPDMILLKRTDGIEDWYMYHTSMGLSEFMRLNLTNAQATAGDLFNTVNSTVFNPSFTGASGQVLIAYCFKNITGYSNFGSYTGNATAGQAITTGFEPTWVLIKSTVGNANWRLYDTTRGITAGGFFRVQATNAEDTSDAPNLDITATGFEINANGVSQGLNASPNLYIYAAFK
jgi:hypothetical protein